MQVWSFCIHLCFILHYCFGIYYYLWKITAPPEVQYQRSIFGGVFKYLTFLDMLLQTIYFIIAFLNDIFGSSTLNAKKATVLQNIRDYLFATIVFSVGTFVTCTFWGLYCINRDYIFPVIYDSFFPRWLNHSTHTFPMIGVFIELWLFPHIYPPLRKGFTSIVVIVVMYALWVCLVAYESGFWVYPILQYLNTVGRLGFIALCSFSLGLCYVLGYTLNSKIWNDRAKEKLKMH